MSSCLLILVSSNISLCRKKPKFYIVILVLFNIIFIKVMYDLYLSLPSSYKVTTVNSEVEIRFPSKYKKSKSKLTSYLTEDSTLNVYIGNFNTEEDYLQQLIKGLTNHGFSLLTNNENYLVFQHSGTKVYVKYKVYFVDDHAIELYIISKTEQIFKSKYAEDFFDLKIVTKENSSSLKH